MGTVLTSLKKIKFRFIGIWLKDQLSRPDWFHSLIVNRSAWGAFSIYAHAKRSDGKSKITYKSRAKAEKAAFDMSKRYGYPFTTYKCLFCDGWLVSKAVGKDATGKTTEEIALDKYAVKASVRPDGLDVERIMSTEIPDLAQVYGGFRGRTMSSRHQQHSLPIIKESGITTYIDLREADKSERLPNLCQLHGLEYFHYPIDKRGQTIPLMVELFPRFCEKIDKDYFYIACAMGLHRTDIALCIYWVFYAADKGIGPPAIRGVQAGRRT